MVSDFNNNGVNDFLFSRGEGFALFEESGESSLPIPMGLSVHPVSDTTLYLTWDTLSDTTIDYYQIYRGISQDQLSPVAFANYPFNTWLDEDVIEDTDYYYAISSSKNGLFSPFSQVVMGIPNAKPELLEYKTHAENRKILTLIFSEPMGDDAKDISNYFVDTNIGHPSSVASSVNDTLMILTFNKPFNENVDYKLLISRIHDQQGNSLVGDTVSIIYPEFPDNPPFLSGGAIMAMGVLLEFSEPMFEGSLMNLDNYSITYGFDSDTLDIAEVTIDTINPAFVLVTISEQTPIGALGHVYYVRVDSVYADTDPPVLIDSERSSISIATSATELNSVYAYPNPYRKGDKVGGEECVVISNVTTSATVRIFNMYGELVNKIESANSFGGIRWYLDNQKGEPAANGIYVYYVEGGGQTFMGKIALAR